MSDDEGPETTPGYKISKKVDMGTILEMDNEDESLRKYKEALLGKAALSGAVARTNNQPPPGPFFVFVVVTLFAPRIYPS